MPVNNAFLDYLDSYDSDDQSQQKTTAPVQPKPVQTPQQIPVQKSQSQPPQKPVVQKSVQQQPFARTMKPRTKIKVSTPRQPSCPQPPVTQQQDEENILNSFNELEQQTKKQAVQNHQKDLQAQRRRESEEEAAKIAERVRQIEQQKKYQRQQRIKQQEEQAKQEEIKKQFQQAAQTQVQQFAPDEVAPQPSQPQFPSTPQTEETPEGEVSPIDLAQAAETCFLEEWFDIYQKGQKSKKRNEAARKIKAGRFRINRNHEVELLPDVVTAGLTANEILERQWI